MQIQYETSPQGVRLAMTAGLVEMEQSEFVLPQTSQVTDEAAARVLHYVGDYILKSGRHIHARETMRYGWSTLRFMPASSGEYLLIEELADPYSPEGDSYLPGAAKAISILMQQDTTVRRNGITVIAHHPHRSELAVICRRVVPGSRVMVFDRLKTTRQDDSGWFVGCGDPDHNHNELSELGRMLLVHLAQINPHVVAYLAMPEDTRVVFEKNKIVVFAPGQDEGRIDEEV